MELQFEPLIPTSDQIEYLYALLLSRKHMISHRNAPSKKEHSEFVRNHPYLAWYLIFESGHVLGSVYLQSDNSIGINLSQPTKAVVLKVIQYIQLNHTPLPPMKSIRNAHFFVNIASDNHPLIEIFQQLNKKEIQRTFVI